VQRNFEKLWTKSLRLKKQIKLNPWVKQDNKMKKIIIRGSDPISKFK
jgi:hypothetical protein